MKPLKFSPVLHLDPPLRKKMNTELFLRLFDKQLIIKVGKFALFIDRVALVKIGALEEAKREKDLFRELIARRANRKTNHE